MPAITPESVREALSHVATPGGGPDLIAADVVTGLEIREGHVGFTIEIDPKFASLFEPVRAEAAGIIERLPGVTGVTAVLTAHSETPSPSPVAAPMPPAQEPPQRKTMERKGRAGLSSAARKQGTPPPPTPEPIAGIKKIIAVASGKGGVGKSTVSVNLAVALAQQGLQVGLLDADIYGPSIPRMLGIEGKPESDGKVLQPMEAFGLKVMSMGFLVEEDTPMIWRGPMVMSALTQMLKDVAWGELDVLVVDMPPGTGDAQLTLVQRVPVAGAVIVSTPQEIALIDARKGMAMFETTNVPVLGMIENMAWLEMPDGTHNYIFGEGGVRRTAINLGTDLLGEIPLYTEIRVGSDEGTPVTATEPESSPAKLFQQIAATVTEKLNAD